ncbi:v-type ATPase [Moesziomyces antarcticus]|uniref:V-type ATPase n=3 Tax=Eukaryota TaxID=2759 RepID=A0A081CHS9_PSEA2|nr:v-type ATPase [Moesziomyces antarcticus]GAK66225.1 v-type ATPase [Moesziomyces antarcticus]
MRRGNNKSVQEKLSDSVSLESGSGMSTLRIGDRNARSHAPSAGAAQPALTRPWLTAFLASSPPPVCCLSVQTKSSRPHPDTSRPPPTRRLHRLASPSVSTASDHTRSCIMAAQQSQGIQTLLEAEKEAAKIVQKARTYRTQKLKDARNEASKEIEQLKANKEKEFADFQKQHEGSTNSSQTTVDKETEERLGELNKAFEANRDQVISKLLDRVVDVKTELHRNLQLQQKA